MNGPLLSLFTPTNNPKFLMEAYESLLVQDYANWEWVLIPNGSAIGRLPRPITNDERVRVGEDPQTENIGGLKLRACNACRGDAFIEFDHDDLLVPGTLKKIAQAIEGGAGFVYSDVAVFNDGSLKSWAYHPSHGWESYDIRVYNKPFKATRCFDITPRSLCEVYYAPDHIRAWERKTYYEAGGHDPELGVGDDHDLVCRTYLTGAPFKHIGDCGYLYRYHQSNTVKLRNTKIQEQQRANRQKYSSQLTAEWCRRHGHQQVEMLRVWKDGKWKPGEPLPFEDNGVGRLVASDMLQFLRPQDQVPFMNEAHRVLMPGGWLHITVPSVNGLYADQDPRHLTRFNNNTWLYYTDRRFAQNNSKITCRFQLVQTYEGYPDENFKQFGMLVHFADLCALKGQRQPGKCLI
jgi:glycosyltransferase involved in cell wall biosynthesis